MKVSCFGDSNTYGYDPRSYYGGRYGDTNRWVDILAARTGWETENLGQNGRAVPYHQYELELYNRIFLKAGTELLIVMLGSNDLLQGMSAESVTGRMKRFIGSLEIEKGKILIIAPPAFQPGAWVEDEKTIERSRKLSALYETLAKECGCHFADSAAWNIELSYDGVHFTESGHRIFAEEIFKLIQNKEI